MKAESMLPLCVVICGECWCRFMRRFARDSLKDMEQQTQDPRHVRGMCGAIGISLAHMEQELGDPAACNRSKVNIKSCPMFQSLPDWCECLHLSCDMSSPLL